MSDRASERAELVEHLRTREDLDERVVEAMRTVPRHRFVPPDQRDGAYRDSPLPIGEGQTISAPHMVAVMANLLDLEPGHSVLEIGTGRGYHAAVTAEIVGPENLYTVEFHDPLAREARETLADLGYGDVSVRAGDGKAGWPEHAPYDRVYLTCAAPEFPDAVVAQLRPGGVALAPIGDGRQHLVRARKREDGSLVRDRHGAVRFVPLQ